MLTDPLDHLRGMTVSVAAAIGADQSIGVLAQAVPGLDNNFLMQIAEKGGGWVVLLIVLFFYRRDWQRLDDARRADRAETIAAANRSDDSQRKLEVALTANTEVLRSIVAQRNGERYEER